MNEINQLTEDDQIMKDNQKTDASQINEDNWLWLCSIEGLYPQQRCALLHFFQNPGAIRQAAADDLALFHRSGLEWISHVEEAIAHPRLQETKDYLARKGIRFVSREHPDFPAQLHTLPDCPHGLFFKGSLPLPGVWRVAIVGARACSAYGAAMARQIAFRLAEAGIETVSGLASGIDGIAQQAAIDSGGMSYGVLGCGVDICYPRENIGLYAALPSQGGIISEFPCGTSPLKANFPMRNRLISAFSNAVAVIEARKHSGSLITADLALDQGRDVYALPGRSPDPLSYGCNHLIAQGAGIILSPEEFAAEMVRQRDEACSMPAKRKKKKSSRAIAQPPTKQEQSLLKHLDYTPRSIEALLHESGLDIRQLQDLLLALQLKGLVQESGKGTFIKL